MISILTNIIYRGEQLWASGVRVSAGAIVVSCNSVPGIVVNAL